MIVRPAKPGDIPAMASLTARAYGTAFAGILEAEALAQRDEAFFRHRFETDWPRMTVAVAGDRVVGLCLVTDGHIDMLFVDPERSGRGAGSALLDEAVKAGARTLECFRDNGPARAFYERRGWVLEHEYSREFLGRPNAFVLYRAPPWDRGRLARNGPKARTDEAR